MIFIHFCVFKRHSLFFLTSQTQNLKPDSNSGTKIRHGKLAALMATAQTQCSDTTLCLCLKKVLSGKGSRIYHILFQVQSWKFISWLAIRWWLNKLTQFSKQLYPKSSVDEKQQHKEKAKISHLSHKHSQHNQRDNLCVCFTELNQLHFYS